MQNLSTPNWKLQLFNPTFILAAALIAAVIGAASFADDSSGVKCAKQPITAKDEASQWYQVGRTLTEKGHLEMGFRALSRVVSAEETAPQRALLPAVLQCLGQIQAERPDLSLPEVKSLERLARSESTLRYAFRRFLQNAAIPKSVAAELRTLESSKLHGLVAEAHLAALRGEFGRAKSLLGSALPQMEAAKDTLPAELRAIQPELQLTYARSLYAERELAPAIAEYRKLFQIGRPMQDALIESGWATLRAKQHAKAIGLSFELQTGKLTKFFSPEANSIQAIAFLENCRYSEAKRAIESFSSAYAPVVEWLAQSNGGRYELAIARAEGVVGTEAIPDRVWSLWSSSEVFHALQYGVRASFREEREVREWMNEEVKDPKLRAILAIDLQGMVAARSIAAEKIEAHFAKLNQAMLARIAAEAERLRFVRIETNQGAGRDLVYLNSHPDVKRLEKSLEEAAKPRHLRSKLYWGKARVNDPKAEVWIDEIGGFEGSALNRCERPKMTAAK